MRRVALRGVRAHLVQFGLSITAVLLGVAFVAGTFALRTMLAGTFDEIIATSVQGDAYLRGGAESTSAGPMPTELGAERTRIPLDLADLAATVDGADLALAELSGQIVLVGADGTAVQNGRSPTFGRGLDPADPTVEVVAGRAPSEPGEIALTAGGLERAGLDLGDTTSVVLAGAVTPATVVGEVSTGAPRAGPLTVFLDPAAARAAYAADGLVSRIAVYADDGVAEADLVRRLEAALAEDPAARAVAGGVAAVTGEEARDDARATVTRILGFIGTFLLVFAGISLFVGAFIIANTFAMSVRQRQREFALLRALGASPTQIMVLVLVQAAVVGVVGSALGVAVGVGLVSALREILRLFDMELLGRVPVEAGTVLVSVAVGTVVSLLAAALPARRAARTPPVEAMRDDGPGTERALHLRGLLGGLLLLGGAGAVLLAVSGRPEEPGPWLGAGAGAVLISAVVLAPVLARAVLRVLAAPAVLALAPMGRLASGNVTRNPRRTANTASALIVGMALVGATTVLASSAQASTRTVVEGESTADLIVQSATFAVPEEAVDLLGALPEVDRADAVTVGSAQVADAEDPAGGADARDVAAVPPGAFGTTLDVTVVAGDPGRLGGRTVAIQRTTAEDEGWGLGDRVQVTTDLGSRELEVVAVIDSILLGAPLVVADSLVEELWGPTQRIVTAAFLTGSPAATPEEFRAAVTDAAAPFVVLSVQTGEELATDLSGQVRQALVILYALLALSIVIAGLGIVNTLALGVIERTREIGLLRAVGLGRAQLAGTVGIESVLTAVFGTALGVTVGIALAAAMPEVFADEGFTDLAVPWGQVGALLAAAVVLGVLAAVWPAIRAARLPVLRAIAQE